MRLCKRSNSLRARDLTCAHIDGQYFTSRTNLFSKIEGGDPMA